MNASRPSDFPPFVPHPLASGGNAMTIWGSLPRRGLEHVVRREERRVVRVDETTSVRVHIDRPTGSAPTAALLILHGLAGSSDSVYVLGTALKAVAAGFLVVRMNARGCGGTEALTTAAYNGGQTEDIEAVARAIVRAERIERLHLTGFSVGANQVLRLASRFDRDGEPVPSWLTSVSAVSPCIDFAASAATLEHGIIPRMIQRRFVDGLKLIVRRQRELGRSAFRAGDLERTHTIREFDREFTAPLSGYAGVEDYYDRAGARSELARITTPTLLVASRDDPLVPFGAFEGLELADAPVRLLATERGGHVGFIGRQRARNDAWTDLDRRWAENRIVQFAAMNERG